MGRFRNRRDGRLSSAGDPLERAEHRAGTRNRQTLRQRGSNRILGAIAVRWTAFPWNDYIRTSIAISDGLSIATHTAEHNANPSNAGSVLLNYFTPEITLSLPDYQQYELAFSIHHRSGLYGLINNLPGTQFGMVGLRMHF